MDPLVARVNGRHDAHGLGKGDFGAVQSAGMVESMNVGHSRSGRLGLRALARTWRRRPMAFGVVLTLVLVANLPIAAVVLAVGQSFALLPPGFGQSVFGVAASSLGGIASAPDGDVWVDECDFGSSPLHRFELVQTLQENGSAVHPDAPVASDAGCGLANHPDGTLYSNASFGVANLDANTAALLRSFGVPGNALGIAVDPQTSDLVYAAADCRYTATCSLIELDPSSGASHIFKQLSSVDAQLVDGITFDPTGDYVFLANRSPVFRLTILNRLGALVQHVALASEPDGLAVHGGAQTFVITNNTDGTLTRLDFPLADYSARPTVSTFASGGFRGDLATVGRDGCLYLTQAGTRFDDGSTSSQSSVVRICGPSDFARQPGVPSPTPTSTPTLTSTPTPTPTSTPTPTVTPTLDVTAPGCALTAVGSNSQGQRYLQVSLQDPSDGLASVTVTTLTNMSAQVGTYQAGITTAPTTVQIPDHTLAPVVVVATRVNSSLSSQLALRVADVAGNVINCDPILTTVGHDPGVSRRETFHHVARGESEIQVYNDTPGLTRLQIEVNGERFEVTDLEDGEVRTVDVARAMRRGNNTITLEAVGKADGSATVLIADR